MYKPIAKMNWLLPHIYSYKFDAQNFYLIIDRRRYMKLLDVYIYISYATQKNVDFSYLFW